MMKTTRYLIPPGSRIDLKKWPTRVKPEYSSKEDYQEILAGHVSKLSKLQNVLYADDRFALLVIFQAMDAAGKDGAIKHVMSGLNPQGCQVYSFKHPSATDLDHDFLWRTTLCLPERGRIGIFNRSYYEEVLIVRVHPGLLEAERVPDLPHKAGKLWESRYRSISDLERHLHANGTRIVKFFLHVSKNEQRKRFIERIEDPEKNWKFNAGDVEERKHWKEYMQAYQEALSATSTRHAPWYVVPADDKENARLIISEVLLDTLKGLDLRYPAVSAEKRRELKRVRKQLEGD
jgi:PPK2 family polyphosphate:nucleotide phosphotransferase